MLVPVILCAVIAFQQVYYLWQIQKLVDKIMSRSYTEYTRAKEPKKDLNISLSQDAPEDLRTLQGFTL